MFKKFLVFIFNCYAIILLLILFFDFNYNLYYVLAVFSFFLVNIYIYLYSIFKQRYRIKKKIKYDYYHDCDLKLIPPVDAGIMLKKNKFGINTFIILLYELVDKKILDRKYENEKVYFMLYNNVSPVAVNKLNIVEQRIVKYIFTGTKDKSCYSLEEILNKFKYTSLGKDIFTESINDYKNNLWKYYESPYVEQLDNFSKIGYYALFIPFFFTFLLGLIEIYCLPNSLYKLLFLLFLFFINIIALYLVNRKVIVKEKYILELNKLNGLYNFLSDFTNIEDKSLKYVEIYDRYYLYALSFGLNDSIINKLK